MVNLGVIKPVQEWGPYVQVTRTTARFKLGKKT